MKIDYEAGMAEAFARAEWIERAPERIFLGRHEEALAGARRLRTLKPGEAAKIEFGDTPSRLLRLVIIPGEAVNVGYASAEEEREVAGLLRRCASALECDLLEF